MADEYRVEFDGLTNKEMADVLRAVEKVGAFIPRVFRNREPVPGGTPLKPTTAGTAQIIKTGSA